MLVALLACDAYLVGLAATVAFVVYPSFHLVGAGQWDGFHRAHQLRIAWAVGPVWALQGVLSLLWILRGPSRAWALAHGLVALGAVLVTLLGAIPRHSRLERHHDSQDIAQLQWWHHVRTALWVGCALIALALA